MAQDEKDRSEYFKQYRKTNSDRRRKEGEKWRDDNPNYFKDYYRRNREKIQARTRARYIANHDECIEYGKKYRLSPEEKKVRIDRQREARRKFPQVFRARKILGKAVKAGIVIRGVCDICGSKNVEAHHPSYEVGQELNVRWLCRYHHMEVEGKILVPREDPELKVAAVEESSQSPNNKE